MDAFFVPALAVGAVGIALWTYLRREPSVRGRFLLAVLRAASLVLLVLLIWNPEIPFGLGSEMPAAPRVLLDASTSMAAPDSSGSSAWEEAVRRARTLAGPGGRVLLFGSTVRTVSVDSLPAAPTDDRSRLAPALERSASLGSRSVDVLSDLRLDDPVEASAAVARGELAVRSVRVGGRIRDAGIVEASVPRVLDGGAEATVDLLLGGEGGAPDDSVLLELRSDTSLLASRRVPLPRGGRPVRHRLPFTAPSGRGTHFLEVRATLPGDVFAADDRRILRLDVEPERSGLVLLSLRPDWEPRYLLGVLEQVTGLRARGWIQLADDRWLPMGTGEERGAVAGDAEVRRAASESGLLVLHGVAAGSPAWVKRLASEAGPLLLLPDDPEGASTTGTPVDEWRAGEWYASPELPTSPVTGELAGVTLEGLPPLTGILPFTGRPPAGRVTLEVQLDGRGPALPAEVLVPGQDRRAAVVLASGFWRWAAREGRPRAAYRRLWSATAGWLLERPAAATTARVEPDPVPVPRGAPVEWRMTGSVGDTVRIAVLAGDSTVVDTSVVEPGPRIRTRVLPPGRYTWHVRASGLQSPDSGALPVSSYSAEALQARVTLPGMSGGDGERAAAGGGRPLRTHPLTYAVLLLLLSAEWIGRRRQGLR